MISKVKSASLFYSGRPIKCCAGQSSPPIGRTSAGFGCAMAAILGIFSGAANAQAETAFTEVGLSQLQNVNAGLNGTGVSVGQVEVGVLAPTNAYPDPSLLGQPDSKFTYVYSSGTYIPPSSSSYGSSSYSTHAENVASFFYGNSGYGIAPGVSHIDVYQEYYYYNDTIAPLSAPLGSSGGLPTSSSPEVVNQSFMAPNAPLSEITLYDAQWDNYAAKYNTLFLTAIGDGQVTATSPYSYINPPSSSYNGIAVGVYSGSVNGGIYGPSSGGSAAWVGPTWDGRSKPDLVAPVPNAGVVGNYTSYSAPVVSGVATLMEQAARGTNLPGPVGLSASDASVVSGGATAYTTAATDIRTVKALLLNGAVKPTGWTNSYTVNSGTYTYNAVNANAVTPLDPRYGSGVVNAYNSYENLAGGEHNFTSTTMQSIAALPSVTSAPTANFTGTFSQAASATNPATITGWNLASISASSTGNAVENYDFNLTGTSLNSWDLTATLTWNKNYNASGINHLMLFLLNSSGQRVASSTSMLDNVQQININPALGINSLAPGQYDLAVEMLGGVNTISTSDTYALAWNFVDPTTVPEPTALAIFAVGLSLLAMPKKRPAGIGGR